jgi:hypothetical protein
MIETHPWQETALKIEPSIRKGRYADRVGLLPGYFQA